MKKHQTSNKPLRVSIFEALSAKQHSREVNVMLAGAAARHHAPKKPASKPRAA